MKLLHTARSLVAAILAMATLHAGAQTARDMTDKTNPLLCDPDTGICAVPGGKQASTTAFKESKDFKPVAKPVTIQYFTDPICSSCWGTEPQLRRLQLQYGDAIDIQVHMGGLVPSWEGFNGGGITKPSDVAGHWDEVSPHYRMPIIGDVWLEDPLPSSYPPSIAYKAAELQDHAKAAVFLRRLREQVMTEKKNITKWTVVAEAATFAGLDTARLKADYDGAANALFQADLTLARSLGVRGFPTFILTNAEGGRQVVYGSRPYAQFEAAVKALAPEAEAAALPSTLEELFRLHPSWCAQEMAVVLDLKHEEVLAKLKQAEAKGVITAVHTRNGSVWHRK
ncbi:MAG TPA: DsbA family protein [Flavobacteriales bacterium]|nr:DsbA family protein [Flavobacteriales bacterium]